MGWLGRPGMLGMVGSLMSGCSLDKKLRSDGVFGVLGGVGGPWPAVVDAEDEVVGAVGLELASIEDSMPGGNGGKTGEAAADVVGTAVEFVASWLLLLSWILSGERK